ncbi:hypothetical protein HanPSC8_Chr15g0684321 [Helianthus annuus]|nr:hypothetical protein HanPSC8_Chr15g0684321 [Helianthus annuus]
MTTALHRRVFAIWCPALRFRAIQDPYMTKYPDTKRNPVLFGQFLNGFGFD